MTGLNPGAERGSPAHAESLVESPIASRVQSRRVRSRRTPAALLIAGLACAPWAASAQDVYKWVDENGETHYSQTLPPERVQQEHARIASDGRVAETVDRAPTAEERAELTRRIRAERDAAQRARLEAQQDRLFLAAYPTEEAVRDSVEAQRQVLAAELGSVEALMQQARQRLNQRLTSAAALERDGRPVPDHLADEIRSARENWAELDQRRAGLQGRLDGLEALLDEELARFRRLTGTEAPAASTASEPADDDSATEDAG